MKLRDAEMKKIMAYMLMLFFLMSATAAWAEQLPGWISEQAGKELAIQYFKEYSGMNDIERSSYHISEISSFWMDENTPVWRVLFDGEENSYWYPTNTYTVYVNSRDGGFVDLLFPEAWNPVDAEFNFLRRSQGWLFVNWSIQQKYDFSQEAQLLWQAYLEKPLERNYMPITKYMQHLMTYQFRLPGKNCMDEESAVQTARNALTEAENMPADDLQQQFTHGVSFLLTDDFTDSEKECWKIFFIPNTKSASSAYYYIVEIDPFSGQILGMKKQTVSFDDYTYMFE